MIGVLNYSAGNVKSVTNALDRMGIQSVLVDNVKKLDSVQGLIIPGVGSFPWAMKQLKRMGIGRENFEHFAASKKILGICLGMQIFYECGFEDGETEGLAMIKGRVIRFPEGSVLPHMGWNRVQFQCESKLLSGVSFNDKGLDAYFAHSYYVSTKGDEVLARTRYAADTNALDFPSVVKKGNLYGVQFHPEKSGDQGLKLLMNFKEMCDENYTSDRFKRG